MLFQITYFKWSQINQSVHFMNYGNLFNQKLSIDVYFLLLFVSETLNSLLNKYWPYSYKSINIVFRNLMMFVAHISCFLERKNKTIILNHCIFITFLTVCIMYNCFSIVINTIYKNQT